MNRDELHALLRRQAVVLAPMEDVTDDAFRRVCRELGADLCFTEFVRAENLLASEKVAVRRIRLDPDDQPTGIQIYGPNPEALAQAARIAEAAGAAMVDVNCGCWASKVTRRGGGAGWLRDPKRMVEMARLVVGTVGLPVTVKTRIGWGVEKQMPIVDLARRLEDAGVAAITIHCRTAMMGHSGQADWSWARRAREVVSIPIVVNGDVRSAEDARRALDETGCAAVMIGRGAIEHPWIFREARALLDRGERMAPPTASERLAMVRRQIIESTEKRGEPWGVLRARRHLAGYLRGLPDGAGDGLRLRLMGETTLAGCLAVLDEVRRAA